MDENLYEEFDVTCETEDCENAGFTLRVWAEKERPQVVCGPCGVVITHVVPVVVN